MRDVFMLRDVLNGIVAAGGVQADAAKHLLAWAVQPTAAAAAVDDGVDDAAFDAVVADDSNNPGDASLAAQFQQQRHATTLTAI